MDAENYSRLPLSQYEEDNVLRELNKALLGFRQKTVPTYKPVTHQPKTRRLSPIGESFSSTPPETENQENVSTFRYTRLGEEVRRKKEREVLGQHENTRN
jgi:Poly (ADP-ribose) glycohydrolase (PARG).